LIFGVSEGIGCRSPLLVHSFPPSHSIDPLNDPHERFNRFGTPPAKQGDYAYLLHIVRSLKSTIIGIHDAKTSSNTTVYDPTCGSGPILSIQLCWSAGR
jgi:type I restriction-modification system DNA methylase subunit